DFARPAGAGCAASAARADSSPASAGADPEPAAAGAACTSRFRGDCKRLRGATLLAAQRSGGAGFLSFVAVPVPGSAFLSLGDHQARRSWLQGYLLPRPGRAVRVFRRGHSVLLGPEGGGRAVSPSAQLRRVPPIIPLALAARWAGTVKSKRSHRIIGLPGPLGLRNSFQGLTPRQGAV